MSAPNVFNVRDYGAVGDGVTDDKAAIDLAIAAAIGFGGAFDPFYHKGSVVYLPIGTYRVTGKIKIWDCSGLVFCGVGKGASTILWDGNTTDPVVQVDGDTNLVRDLTIKAVTYYFSAIEFSSQVGGGYTSTSSSIERVDLSGPGKYGVDFTTIGAITSGNNDLYRVRACDFSGYTDGAIHVNGSQSHGHHITDCTFEGGQSGLYGVWCEYGAYVHVERCRFTGHTGADVYLQNFHIINTIYDCVSRDSARFCTIGGTLTATAAPTRITGCDVNHGSHLYADGATIRSTTAGPIVVVNSQFEATNGNPRLFMTAFVNTPTVVVKGCSWKGAASYTYSRTIVSGSLYCGAIDAGSQQILPSILDGGNMFWDTATLAYVHKRMPVRLNLGSWRDASATVKTRNSFGTLAFTAGEQQKTVTFDRVEANANYLSFVTGLELTSGVTTGRLSATTLTKTTTGFDIRLSTPAVAGVTASWMILRT